MGIDARILVKIITPECHITDPIPYAYELASTIGHSNFSIGENHHAISIIGQDEIGKIIWEQDGPDIIALPNEQFLEVHLTSRYWGPGYERGSWPELHMIISWFHHKFANSAEVWYGGDSSAVCMEHMTPQRLTKFDLHFLSNGRRPYTRYEGKYSRSHFIIPSCPICHTHTFSTGGGGAEEFWCCDGCGRKFITSSTGIYQFDYHYDIFQACDRVRTGKASSTKLNEWYKDKENAKAQ